VVLLYAGGVSLNLPDVQFGMVSQDWVILSMSCNTVLDCLQEHKMADVFVIYGQRYIEMREKLNFSQKENTLSKFKTLNVSTLLWLVLHLQVS